MENHTGVRLLPWRAFPTALVQLFELISGCHNFWKYERKIYFFFSYLEENNQQNLLICMIFGQQMAQVIVTEFN